ncbi:hypothetical protein AMECASPLE_013397 [Ameca splendens]|uniref:Uncharacterized protein n=1 Tax=Ameca splendens TaxID=208324 RepID=A0ABV1A7N8_9TELE
MHVSRTRTRTHRLPLYPGPGRRGSRLSRDTQTSLSPDTSSSTSRREPKMFPGQMDGELCFSAQLSHHHKDRHSVPITGSAAPIHLSVSCSILSSLVNKTPRYLNSST